MNVMPETRYIYIYIYRSLDNRCGFVISIGNTKNHVATLTCLECHTENMLIESTKTMSIEDVSTGLLEKIKNI